MQSVNVLLNSIVKVKGFVDAVTHFDSDFDMCSGRYTVDAKSIMGIFSLDLSKPVQLVIYSDHDLPQVLEAIAPYLAEG